MAPELESDSTCTNPSIALELKKVKTLVLEMEVDLWFVLMNKEFITKLVLCLMVLIAVLRVFLDCTPMSVMDFALLIGPTNAILVTMLMIWVSMVKFANVGPNKNIVD